MKVSELSGAQLDYWVAKAEGVQILYWDGKQSPWIPKPNGVRDDYAMDYAPSTEWSQGGPIIERESIELLYFGIHGWMNNPWEAQIGCDIHFIDQGPYDAMPGPTPLIAAMRAYVASKFGDEVEDGVGK